jgi:hypothetical protein
VKQCRDGRIGVHGETVFVGQKAVGASRAVELALLDFVPSGPQDALRHVYVPALPRMGGLNPKQSHSRHRVTIALNCSLSQGAKRPLGTSGQVVDPKARVSKVLRATASTRGTLMYRKTVLGAGLAASALLAACGGAAEDSANAPALDGAQQYDHTDDLIADLAQRGITCDDVDQRDTSRPSATCFIDDEQVVPMVGFLSAEARDRQVKLAMELQANLGGSVCWVVGRGAGNWVMNVGDDEICSDVADALGGSVERPRSAERPLRTTQHQFPSAGRYGAHRSSEGARWRRVKMDCCASSI